MKTVLMMRMVVICRTKMIVIVIHKMHCLNLNATMNNENDNSTNDAEILCLNLYGIHRHNDSSVVHDMTPSNIAMLCYDSNKIEFVSIYRE